MMRAKSRILRLLLFLFLFGTIVMLFRLHRDSTDVRSEGTAQHRYVFLSPEKEESFFRQIAEGVKGADREEGSDTLLVEYSENDAILTYFQDAMFSEPEGIIVKGTADIPDEISQAVESGIPVIFYNNDVEGSGRSSYVGIDNYAAGKMAFERVLSGKPSLRRLLVIVRGIDAGSMAERIAAISDEAEENPQVKVDYLETSGDEVQFRNGLSGYLDGDDPPDAIICMDDNASELLGDYMTSSGIEPGDIYTVTTDDTASTSRYLESGIYDAAVLQDIYQIGYQAVSLLNEYYDSGETAGERAAIPDSLYLENIVITADNAQEYFDQHETETLYWNTY